MVALRREVVAARALTWADQDRLIADIADEAASNGVLVARVRGPPSDPRDSPAGAADLPPAPALKLCASTGLSRRESEKAAAVVRHAILKVMTRKR